MGPVPLTDLPEEWSGDLARMYETVGKDALLFANGSRKRVSPNGERAPALES